MKILATFDARDYEGTTAIYNIFTGVFYADDVYGVIEPEARKRGFEM